MGQVILDPEKGLKHYLGVDVLEKNPQPKGPYGTSYRWPDEEKTYKSAAAIAKFGSEEDAKTAYKDAYDQMSVADGDGQHEKAKNALEKARSNMAPVVSCSGS